MRSTWRNFLRESCTFSRLSPTSVAIRLGQRRQGRIALAGGICAGHKRFNRIGVAAGDLPDGLSQFFRDGDAIALAQAEDQISDVFMGERFDKMI